MIKDIHTYSQQYLILVQQMRLNSTYISPHSHLINYYSLIQSLLLNLTIPTSILVQQPLSPSSLPLIPHSVLQSPQTPPANKKNRTDAYIHYSLSLPHMNLSQQSLQPLINSFLLIPNNKQRVIVLLYFKSKYKYNCESGESYGVDFVGYQSSSLGQDLHSHSKCLIKVKGGQETLAYKDIQGLIKVANSVKKRLVLVEVVELTETTIDKYFIEEIWREDTRRWEEVFRVREIALGLSRLK